MVPETRTARTFVWGSGGAGQLGLGNVEDFALPQELDTHELVHATIISGGCHSAGFSNQGQLYVWGDNEKGQLAMAREVESLAAPTRVPTQNMQAHDVACGWSHTILVAAVRPREDDGQPHEALLSCGAHEHYQLGRTSSTEHPPSVPCAIDLPCLATGRRVVSVSCGWKHSLLALDDGSVYSWGSGRHGELGLGGSQVTAPQPTLVAIPNEAAIDTVCCGWQYSVLFSRRTGFIYSCGNNRHGQLGVPKTSEPSRTQPAKVLDARGQPLEAVDIAVGWHFAVCLSKDGKLLSWGKGAHGQLGLGSFETVDIPTVVQFSGCVTSIACGSEHTMVVTDQGELFTCGWGEHGNLGHNDTENRSSLTKVTFFSEGDWHVEAVSAGGAVSIAHARSALMH